MVSAKTEKVADKSDEFAVLVSGFKEIQKEGTLFPPKL